VDATERLRARDQRARLARLMDERRAQDESLSELWSQLPSPGEATAVDPNCATEAAPQLAVWFDQRVDLAAPAPASRPFAPLQPRAIRG
jgi:hypothetical protein